MKETFVYGLDVSLSNTGIAIFTTTGKFVECSSIDTTSERDIRNRLVIIANEYKKYIKTYTPEIVVIESSFSRFNISTQMIFRCVGLTNYIFSQYEQMSIPATTIKKTMTGNGHAKKNEVRKYVLKMFPDIRFNDFDESDAVAVAITYFIKQGVLQCPEKLSV